MASMEVQCVGRRGPVMRSLSNLSSQGYCFDLAMRMLRRGDVLQCRCRTGGFVLEIDHSGYRTRRDLSVGIGE